MSIWQVFKVSRKTFFYPSAWIDLDWIVESNRAIKNTITDLFVIPEAGRKETFNEAAKHFNLSEEALDRLQNRYYIYALLFLVLGISTFLLSLFLLFFHGAIGGFIIGVPTAGLFLAQAFKYHFWHFQIKHRKLGCTFDEWRRGRPFEKGEKKS